MKRCGYVSLVQIPLQARVLVVAVVIGGVVAMAAHAQTGSTTGFVEKFSSTKLPSPLRWHAPVPGPVYRISNGALHIELPESVGGFDVWTESDNAPSLFAEAPVGDWDMSARIRLEHVPAEAEFHAGLAERFSDGHTMLWGPYQSRRFTGVDGRQIWLERTGEGRMDALSMSGDVVDLRVEKRGAHYTFALRREGEASWSEVAATSSLSEAKQVGVVVKTFSSDGGRSQPVSVAVEELALTPVEEASASANDGSVRIDVTRDGLFKVDRNIYGHFIEHLGKCIHRGLWAELLNNRKFAGSTSAKGVIERWEPVGTADFSDGHDDPYTGGQYQRIVLTGAPAGIAQAGIGLIADKSYDVRIIARAPDQKASLRARLGAAEVEVGAPRVTWQEFKVTLKSAQNTAQGRFEILASGSGRVDIGCVSVMPSDNLQGFRRDVIETVRAIKPPNVRWPGGNFVSGYDWREGIGPRDRRPPRWDRAWRAWEMNDVGTDEFIDFCRLLDTQPYICVNAGEGTPRQAAEWVEYCNGSTNTAMGALRAANGHPQPYDVLLWGTGNEIWGDWQLGHVSAVIHALKAVELARAMLAVDPRLKLVLCGVDGDSYGDWNRQILPVAGQYHDYLAVHYYKRASFADPPALLYESVVTAPDDVEQRLRHTLEIIREKIPQRPIPVAFDEWNVSYARALQQNPLTDQPPLADALFEAGVFHAMIRLGDRVTLANLAQLVNVLGLLRVSDTEVLKTPGFLAFEMYAPHFYGQAQSVTLPERLRGLVDIVAVRPENAGTLAVGLINRSLDRACPVTLALSGFKPQRVSLMRINASSIEATNTWKNPDAIRILRENPKWTPHWELPAHSVTVLLLSER